MNPPTGSSKSSSGRGPGRPSNTERAESLASTIEGGLKGLADILERHDEPDDIDSLSGLIKRDARRQAEWLAALANRHSGVETAVKRLFGAGSILGAAGAFGPLASALYDRVRTAELFGFLHAQDDDDGDQPPPGLPGHPVT